MELTKSLVTTIAKIAIAKAKVKGATKNIDAMIKCRAITRPLLTRSDVPVDMLFETFLKVLADVQANRYDWKVYVQVVNDLGKVIRAAASKEQRMLLINGSKAKHLVGLQDLSAFVKLKVRFGFAKFISGPKNATSKDKVYKHGQFLIFFRAHKNIRKQGKSFSYYGLSLGVNP